MSPTNPLSYIITPCFVWKKIKSVGIFPRRYLTVHKKFQVVKIRLLTKADEMRKKQRVYSPQRQSKPSLIRILKISISELLRF